MVTTRHISVKDGDVLLLIGTMKGAFLLRSDIARSHWEVGGPYFPGHSVYAMAYDGRHGRRRLWASSSSMHWGAVLRSSDDFGMTWTNPETANVRFPESTGTSLKQIWQIVPGRAKEPDTLYCGVEPAALFESRDNGGTWSLVRGLYETRTGCAGSRAAGGCACTPFCRIRATPGGFTSRSRPAASTAPTTGDRPGALPTRVCAPNSYPTSTPSSASAYTRSRGIRRGPSGCSCRTTGGSTAATTPGSRGRISHVACRRTLALLWSCTRTIQRRSTSCPSSLMSSDARRRENSASTARETVGARGNR